MKKTLVEWHKYYVLIYTYEPDRLLKFIQSKDLSYLIWSHTDRMKYRFGEGLQIDISGRIEESDKRAFEAFVAGYF